MRIRRPLPLTIKTTLSFVAVNLLAAALIFLPFYLTFWNNISHRYNPGFLDPIRSRWETLWKSGGNEPALLAEIATALAEYHIQFVAFDDTGRILAASEGVTAPFFPHSHGWFDEHFSTPASDSRPTLYGISKRKHGTTIQLATSDPAFFYEAFIDRLMNRLAIIGGVFLAVTLGANVVILRRSLRPLRRVSEEAEAIGPQSTSRRLSEQEIPVEVLPLVRAINLVLDRLEDGYKAQRDFISDAAHELRTPLAVLKAHLDILDDRQIANSLEDDLSGMERLVSQLLAMARLDGIHIEDDDIVDLSALTVDVARHLGPIAFERNREIEVIGGDRPILVCGLYDFLFRALRNLVENALRHGPPGSVVTLRLAPHPPSVSVADHGPGIPAEMRETIFQRFWRGERDRRSDEGVGLGLAIVSATVTAHGGNIDVGDASGGGAVFTMRLPEPR
jgi:signal transduction histidine kinase